MAHITLSKQNFFHNLDILVKKVQSIEKIALVLKDNAYGHGILEIASLAKQYGIKKAVVQNEFEANKIEDYFDYILVLADYPYKFNEKLRYTINDIESIENFPQNTKVHLKVDTGMHRNGIAMDQLEIALKLIEKQGLVLEAIMTHHRSADELSSEWFWQNQNFDKVKNKVIELKYKNLYFHSCNSAALMRTQSFEEDFARVGIAAYGCLEMPKGFENGFKPVLSVYAQKISSRKLYNFQAVGYGATFRTEKECVVSNYNFGYGAGFLRSCSNKYVSPDGFSLLGRVSMDNCSFESEDENICIFDDARNIAKSAGTISYEVLTSLKESIPREIVE